MTIDDAIAVVEAVLDRVQRSQADALLLDLIARGRTVDEVDAVLGADRALFEADLPRAIAEVRAMITAAALDGTLA